MSAKKILVIGAGAREHALAWRLQVGAGDTPLADREVVVAPGNAGIAHELPVLPLDLLDVGATVALARQCGAHLVVIGPEQPLINGAIDALWAAGIPAFGPTAACAKLEGSKAFMKEVCREAMVPTAEAAHCTTLAEAEAFIAGRPGDVVVKADGLCAGKGVTVCDSAAQAIKVCADMLGEGGRPPLFGEASRTVVVEDRLPGRELSVFALCDGERALLFPCARDHKRLLDGDRGPNTGGMGAVAPLLEDEGVTPALLADVETRVFRPVLAALAKRGTPYRGILYAGLMLSTGAYSLLEFNVRLGDPEAEALLFGLRFDLLPLFEVVARGAPIPDDAVLPQTCVPSATVVVASRGYPEAPTTGDAIEGLAAAQALADTHVFCAGVKAAGDGLVTAGGRVLACTGRGASLVEALARAYAAARTVTFTGAQYRNDIGASLTEGLHAVDGHREQAGSARGQERSGASQEGDLHSL